MRPITTRQVLGVLLAGQLGLALLMTGGDLAKALPRIGWPSSEPAFDQPTSPGDQTRRFSPRRMKLGPAREGNPDRPYRDTGEMPERLQIERAGETMTLTGRIEEGDGARFDEALGKADGVTRVRLNSPGGSVADALEIGRKVRGRGLETMLAAGDICLSACPYLLAGGTVRTVDSASQVGVHQSYFGANVILPAFMAVDDVQRGQGEVMAFLDTMGIDPMLMQPALVTPSDEIYVLTDAELTRYRLATVIVGK